MVPAAIDSLNSLLSRVGASFRESPSGLLIALQSLKKMALETVVMAISSRHEAHKAIGRQIFYDGKFDPTTPQPQPPPPPLPSLPVIGALVHHGRHGQTHITSNTQE